MCQATYLGADYVVKTVRGEESGIDLSEFSIMINVNHPNVVQFMGVAIGSCNLDSGDEDVHNLVMEYCDGGDLLSLLQDDSCECDWVCLYRAFFVACMRRVSCGSLLVMSRVQSCAKSLFRLTVDPRTARVPCILSN